MSMLSKTSLEQWQLLQEVIACGSFARAAERVNRSQSAISYQLGLMQERLGIALLMPQGRRAVLTPEGQILLAQARPLLDGFAQLENRAASLKAGSRARIDLVVDSIFPRGVLFGVLRQFQQRHPATQVHLTEVLRGESAQQLQQRQADILILTRESCGQRPAENLLDIDFVAVAQREHPLLALAAPLAHSTLARFPLVEILDRHRQQDGPQAVAENWTFTSIEAAVEAVLHQVGYGWLPASQIAPWLESGELQPLPLSSGQRRTSSLCLLVDPRVQAEEGEIVTLLTLFRALNAAQSAAGGPDFGDFLS